MQLSPPPTATRKRLTPSEEEGRKGHQDTDEHPCRQTEII